MSLGKSPISTYSVFWGGKRKNGGGVTVGAYLSFSGKGRGWGGAGRYSRWAPIRGWALIRINTVYSNCELKMNVDDTHPAYANSDVKKCKQH